MQERAWQSLENEGGEKAVGTDMLVESGQRNQLFQFL